MPMRTSPLILAACVLWFGHGHAQDSVTDHSSRAKIIQSKVELMENSSNSAMQVSQIHDQARTELLVILIQQNDEILQILREIKNKKIKDFLF